MKKSYFILKILVVIISGFLFVSKVSAIETNDTKLKWWQVIDGKVYYFNYNNEMVKGLNKINGYTYFFNEDTGAQEKGFITSKSGKKYYADQDGAIQKGIISIDNNTYFFDENTGELCYNFCTLKSGKTYYTGNDGILRYWWQVIDGKVYYFDGVNGMVKGLTHINGYDYYFNQVYGYQEKGFITVNDKTKYFADENGAIQKGIVEYNNNKYFFDEDNGKLRYNFITAKNGNVYYTGNNGIIKVGSIVLDGLKYTFDQNGVLIGGWQQKDGKTYYLKSDGTYAKDWIIIQGEKSFFNSLGVLIARNAKKILDVSEYQKEIDWNKVKEKAQIDGVIVRIGFGSVKTQEDAYLKRNISELKRLGIPYGIYLYSYAENSGEAKLEADFTKYLINKYNINPTLGIYLDLEDSKYAARMGKTNLENVVKTYYNELKNIANVKVYSNPSYINNYMNNNTKNYIGWVSQYYHYCEYKGNYNMWQYSSIEYVPGITGNADLSVKF